MCELKEIQYLIAVLNLQNPTESCYHLAAGIVANKPMQTHDVTSHETATGNVYMRVVSNCVGFFLGANTMVQ